MNFVNFSLAYLVAFNCAFIYMFLPCTRFTSPFSQACSLLNIGLVPVLLAYLCCPYGIFVIFKLIYLLVAYLDSFTTQPFLLLTTHHTEANSVMSWFYQASKKFLSEFELVYFSLMWSLTTNFNSSVFVELLEAH